MKKILFSIIFLTISISAFAATNNLADCEYNTVNTAIDSAFEGDIIVCPSDEATWPSTLAITKGITLKGDGAGSTIITNGITGDRDDSHLITYSPTAPENNAIFEIYGFTFDIDGQTQFLKLSNSDHTNPQTEIKIHDNTILNLYDDCSGDDSVTIDITGGSMFGVFYSNTITGGALLVHTDSQQRDNWDDTTFTPGGANSFYFEDNTITVGACATNPSASPTIGSGWGGRYVARYNTFIYTGTGGIFPWFDMHGNQPSSVYSTMGAEVYGNSFSSSTFTGGNTIRFFSHRGGEAILFWNYATTTNSCSGDFSLNEEYADNISTTDHASSLFSGSSDGQPQHISDSYYWNNRYKTTLLVPDLGIDCCDGTGGYGPDSDCCYNTSGTEGILHNTDWWQHDESFNGTSGMGCGSELPANCDGNNEGYWLTDQTCSSVSGDNIGANPTIPIQGTLYRCTSPNTWTVYFTPYTYPHPLRESPNISGISISGVTLN